MQLNLILTDALHTPFPKAQWKVGCILPPGFAPLKWNIVSCNYSNITKAIFK